MAKIVNGELVNLMELLDEQDATLYAMISENIQSYGLSAIPYLEVVGEKSLDETVQSRVKKLIQIIKIQGLYGELHNWAALESSDLLKGYLICSKYLFPDIDEKRVMAQVEALKKEVWLELKQDMTPFEGAKVISKLFFEIKKFSFETDAGSYFESMGISQLLETGKSLPIAFVLLYAGIAQRLGLHFYGVNLPVPGFLGYVQLKNHKVFDFENDLMFYLNPFAEGVFFQKASIYEGLKVKYADKMDEYTGACDNVKFILQYLEFVKSLCFNTKKSVKFLEINMLIEALKVEKKPGISDLT